MKTFTIKSDDSFKFTSKLAFDTSEVFTAIKDIYGNNGYIIIDSKQYVYIISDNEMHSNLGHDLFIIVNEDVEGNVH